MKGLHLHFDCASGIAGDMTLGALIDLGVPVDVIGDALDAIGAGRGRLHVARVTKGGIAAVDVKVDASGSLDLGAHHEHAHADTHSHSHSHGHSHSHSHGHSHSFGNSHGHSHGHEHEHSHEHSHSHADGHTHSHADGHTHSHADGHTHSHSHADGHSHEHADGHSHEHADGHSHEHGHGHGHGHVHPHSHDSHTHAAFPRSNHAHYHYGAIRARIAGSSLGEGTKRRALDIFDRLARAEAKLHGTTIEEVALHEVGAIDSVVDIVGTSAALEWLSPANVTCASVAMGHGTLNCAHGVLPVPAPAALEVLRAAGGVMADGGIARELCTPTGAAILAASVTRWVPAPTGRPVAVGWGAGDSDLPDRANVVRATVLETAVAAAGVWQIEANIDDMSSELCGPAADAVFDAGALDVWWTPITMKKGRPALVLSALAETQARGAVIAAILRETTTIGVRFSPRERTVLARSTVIVSTRYGSIPIKVARDGEALVNAAPEYEACAAAARAHGVPVKLVFAAALAAFDGNA